MRRNLVISEMFWDWVSDRDGQRLMLNRDVQARLKSVMELFPWRGPFVSAIAVAF